MSRPNVRIGIFFLVYEFFQPNLLRMPTLFDYFKSFDKIKLSIKCFPDLFVEMASFCWVIIYIFCELFYTVGFQFCWNGNIWICKPYYTLEIHFHKLMSTLKMSPYVQKAQGGSIIDGTIFPTLYFQCTVDHYTTSGNSNYRSAMICSILDEQ